MLHINSQLSFGFISKVIDKYNTYTSSLKILLLDGTPVTKSQWVSYTPLQKLDLLSGNTLPAGTSLLVSTSIPIPGNITSNLNNIVFHLFRCLRLYPISGVPTWFVLGVGESVLTVDSEPFLLGTVGSVGSGADMEINDLPLDASKEFMLSDLTFRTKILFTG